MWVQAPRCTQKRTMHRPCGITRMITHSHMRTQTQAHTRSAVLNSLYGFQRRAHSGRTQTGPRTLSHLPTSTHKHKHTDALRTRRLASEPHSVKQTHTQRALMRARIYPVIQNKHQSAQSHSHTTAHKHKHAHARAHLHTQIKTYISM